MKPRPSSFTQPSLLDIHANPLKRGLNGLNGGQLTLTQVRRSFFCYFLTSLCPTPFTHAYREKEIHWEKMVAQLNCHHNPGDFIINHNALSVRPLLSFSPSPDPIHTMQMWVIGIFSLLFLPRISFSILYWFFNFAVDKHTQHEGVKTWGIKIPVHALRMNE